MDKLTKKQALKLLMKRKTPNLPTVITTNLTVPKLIMRYGPEIPWDDFANLRENAHDED